MSFHSINWLYAGIAATLAVVALFAWGERRRKRLLAEFASAKLLPELSRTVSPAKKFVKKTLLALGIFAVFAALARPQWGYHWAESKTRGIDIIFAIDTSKSMLAEDVKPSRLERAKLSVLDLLDALDGDRIGIVAFSGQAFLQCPLTLDYDAFRLSLEALDTNVIQRGGTNIAAAISEADAAFEKTANHKIVVLISDGEELESSAVERAKQAAKDGVVIYTLGVGGAKGEPIPVRDAGGRLVQLRDENGKIVASKLNEAVLSEIAKSTGGFYEPLSANGMDAIYENGLKKIPQRELSARMKQLAIERFQIPLAAAIILLALESLVGTRRFFAGGNSGRLAALAFAAVSAAALVSPQNARAEANAPDAQTAQTEASEKSAEAQTDGAKENPNPAPAEPKNPTPREVFNSGIDLLAKGDTAAAQGKFLDAIKAEPYGFALHAKAFYNIANADYAAAKHSLADAEAANELGAKAAQLDQAEAAAMSGGTVLLQQGAPLLQKELETVKAAKTDEEKKKALESSPLKDKQFQQSLKQGIAQCEAVEKQSAELAGNASQNLEKWNNAKKILDGAIGGYKSAAELDPAFNAAQNNLQSALVAEKNLDNETSKIKKLSDALSSDAAKQRLARLAKLKEELKKLVRDDNNQNQDKNQNQQQNQQQNQNQNQDQQQNQQQNQNKNQDKNQQQNSQQNQQNKQNDNQDKQQNNSKDNKEQNSEKNNDRQNSPDKNDASQNGGRQDKPQNGDEQNRDEQAVDNKKPQEQNGKPEQSESKENRGQDKRGQNAGNEERELPAEQKQAEKKQAAAAQAAEKDVGKDSENYRSAVGAMTKGEARQLLESMKDSDKVLPLRGYGEQRNRFEKSYKDW